MAEYTLYEGREAARVTTSDLKWARRDAKKPLREARKVGRVAKSNLKWQMRERSGKASKKA